MSALAEALLAAQRQAVGSLSKAFVAGKISGEDLIEECDRIGLRDGVDQGLLVQALEVAKHYGAEAPKAGGNGTPRESKPASDAQWKLIRRLADERGLVAPEGPLTLEQASLVISESTQGIRVSYLTARRYGLVRSTPNGITLCGSCHVRWHRGSLILPRSIFTAAEWAYVSGLRLGGRETAAWLDKHYPERVAA